MKSEKIGVFLNQGFFLNQNKKFSTDLSFIRFIESFEKEFFKIKIFAPVKFTNTRETQGNYLCSEFLDFCCLPYYHNVKDLFKKSLNILPKIISRLKMDMIELDRLWIVVPHPLAIFANYYADKYNIASFLHVRGNILNDVKIRYRKSYTGKVYAQYMHWSNYYLSKRMTTLTVGSELYKLYENNAKPISWISPSLISEEDIKLTRATINSKFPKNGRYIKLLFVGRVEPEKGLEYLFEAIKYLNKSLNLRFKLIIVGSAQRGSENKEIEIKNFAKNNGISQFIDWKGYISYGEELKKIYRNGDIFILPSLTEGIPKVIYEAMAFGIPIISTKVGGICDIIENNKNGVLIKPKSKEEIVSAIKLIAGNTNFRKNLIENGLEDAKLYTIEEARKRILSAMDIK